MKIKGKINFKMIPTTTAGPTSLVSLKTAWKEIKIK